MGSHVVLHSNDFHSVIKNS